MSGWIWGDGRQAWRHYDQDGQLAAQTLGPDQRSLTYDLAGNIKSITDSADTRTYGYDALDRLTSASDANYALQWHYDANGNRTQQVSGSATTTYTLDPASNRLTQLTGASTASYGYDAKGNILADGSHTYQYDARNRLVTVDNGQTAQYLYNGLGQRVDKKASSDERLFDYQEWQLLGEYSPGGSAVEETVWLGGLPVATVRGGTVYYVHTDQLGTPRALSEPTTGTVVWRWDSDPFGTTAANEDPDGNQVLVAYNLRFPGQYFDQETGLNYNYFRDYDPSTGRYVESDPIGLEGGLNTYAYVGSNPIRYKDSKGQCIEDGCVGEALLLGLIFEKYGPEITSAADEVAALAENFASDIEGLATEAGAECQTLYRVVKPDELLDILDSGQFRNLGSAEGKYFTDTAESASSYAQQAVSGIFSDPPYTMIQTQIPSTVLNNLIPAEVDGGINAWVVPNEVLPDLTPQVLNSMAIPK